MEDSKMSDRKQRLKRLSRDKINIRNLTNVTEEDMNNFVYRLVIENHPEEPTRVERFREWGYEVFAAHDEVGDKRSSKPSKLGSTTAKLPAGAGKNFVLMRIPKELFEENQVIKDEQIKEDMARASQINEDRVKGGLAINATGATINSDNFKNN